MDQKVRKRGQRAAIKRDEYRRRKTEKKAWSGEVSEPLLRLLICLGLFLTVFLGRGVFPEGMVRVRDELLALLTANTNFRAIFLQVGESITGGNNLLEDIYVEVFGSETEKEEAVSEPQLTGLWSEECRFLNESPALALRTSHYTQNFPLQLSNREAEEVQDAEVPLLEREDTVPAAGTVVLDAQYGGQPLPEGYTMNQLSLGGLETVTPVIGRINSLYGYRDHPIDGRYQFHGGVDIGGQTGDSIQAFADGTVEYIGEDRSYGLYLQLDHGNGIKSFYAHCNSICVKKGQSVSLGEKVAEVGSTGAATGPHLHLELKYENIHMDPIYYIEYLSLQ